MVAKKTLRYTLSVRNPRGASLATTLVFACLALLFGLALASSSISHLHFGRSQAARQHALNAAEAAVSVAIEKLMRQPDFGHRDNPDDFVELTFDSATARITFDPDQADNWGIEHSTNNRGSTESTAGVRGRQIPPEGVQIIAVGRSGNTQRTLEVVLEVPGFPYTMVSSGPINSEGSLLIGGLENLEDAFPTLNEDELEPADMASNAPGNSVDIQGEATITGNIQARGNIKISDQVSLDGVLKPFSDSVPVAELDLDKIRPHSSSSCQGIRSGGDR